MEILYSISPNTATVVLAATKPLDVAESVTGNLRELVRAVDAGSYDRDHDTSKENLHFIIGIKQVIFLFSRIVF